MQVVKDTLVLFAQAVRGFTAMQIVAAAVGTMCLLGLSASLGRGLSLFSMYPISMLTGEI